MIRPIEGHGIYRFRGTGDDTTPETAWWCTGPTPAGRKDVTERRVHLRYRVSEGVFAVLNASMLMVGQVIDVSMGGIAYIYIANEKSPQGSFTLDILISGEGYHLRSVPCRIISDTPALSAYSFTSVPMRRQGIQFETLGQKERARLRELIRTYSDASR